MAVLFVHCSDDGDVSDNDNEDAKVDNNFVLLSP